MIEGAGPVIFGTKLVLPPLFAFASPTASTQAFSRSSKGDVF
jgi:hypothetical protein